MKEITFDMAENPKIKVNGIEFDILMSDVEIMSMTAKLTHEYEKLSKGSHKADEIISALEKLCDGVDAILGEGAAAKIAGGKPISIAVGLRMLNTVAQACVDAYADRLAEMYA